MSAIHFINRKYLPPKIPVMFGIVLWLLLDRLQPAGWIVGVIWTLYAIIAAAAIFCICVGKYHHPADVPKQPPEKAP